jgi:hypothetical protein
MGHRGTTSNCRLLAARAAEASAFADCQHIFPHVPFLIWCSDRIQLMVVVCSIGLAPRLPSRVRLSWGSMALAWW